MLRLAVLISGGGTTLKNLIQKIEAGQLAARIELVLSSNSQAGGLEFAKQTGIPTGVVRRPEFESPQAYSQAIFDRCREVGADLVVMGGFLKHVLIPPDFEGKVVNIHPSLIPAFCGKGYYGERVHAAVLEYGAKVSGCTVHFVDNQYDHGPIILQKVVDVNHQDTPATLAKRVFQLECDAYPEAIQMFAEGRLKLDGRQVHVRP
jgi:phosphoribosylglycinamide formyltransferase-1